MDPLREAIRHRRAKGLELSASAPADGAVDDSKLEGQPAGLKDEPKGDLAPEAEDTAGLEANSPEHHPLARSLSQDDLGHEQALIGPDEDVESHLMSGHELDGPRSPKTLGARVRAALQSKKGSM